MAAPPLLRTRVVQFNFIFKVVLLLYQPDSCLLILKGPVDSAVHEFEVADRCLGRTCDWAESGMATEGGKSLPDECYSFRSPDALYAVHTQHQYIIQHQQKRAVQPAFQFRLTHPLERLLGRGNSANSPSYCLRQDPSMRTERINDGRSCRCWDCRSAVIQPLSLKIIRKCR